MAALLLLMNGTTLNLWSGGSSPLEAKSKTTSVRWDLMVFGIVVFLLNWTLLFGHEQTAFVFVPALVRNGEWWRVFTHPFVHVSFYHLLLDASAFFLVYSGLEDKSWVTRVGYVVASAVGSLAISLLCSSQIASLGLCGLSGIAHGLLAISALEMMRSTDTMIARAGWVTFAIIIGKAAIEAITGSVVFDFLHFGNIGTPIAVGHAGGVVGVLVLEFVRSLTTAVADGKTNRATQVPGPRC
jgi:rhomboid family GlyGly-CTERM serine protease